MAGVDAGQQPRFPGHHAGFVNNLQIHRVNPEKLAFSAYNLARVEGHHVLIARSARFSLLAFHPLLLKFRVIRIMKKSYILAAIVAAVALAACGKKEEMPAPAATPAAAVEAVKDAASAATSAAVGAAAGAASAAVEAAAAASATAGAVADAASAASGAANVAAGAAAEAVKKAADAAAAAVKKP